MPAELPYAISKGAIHGIDAHALRGARTAGDHRQHRPTPGRSTRAGPTTRSGERTAPRLSGGALAGRPEDIAPVVAFLCSDDAAWLTGNVLDAEGGFGR